MIHFHYCIEFTNFGNLAGQANFYLATSKWWYGKWIEIREFIRIVGLKIAPRDL